MADKHGRDVRDLGDAAVGGDHELGVCADVVHDDDADRACLDAIQRLVRERAHASVNQADRASGEAGQRPATIGRIRSLHRGLRDDAQPGGVEGALGACDARGETVEASLRDALAFQQLSGRRRAEERRQCGDLVAVGARADAKHSMHKRWLQEVGLPGIVRGPHAQDVLRAAWRVQGLTGGGERVAGGEHGQKVGVLPDILVDVVL
mmetsp:Transcript_97597/g.281640  ORF Transcript_97597/g.281640 Transcript_97597/m.281640 type:complete len:207 (-) Transcript_97597:457-1077(-)